MPKTTEEILQRYEEVSPFKDALDTERTILLWRVNYDDIPQEIRKGIPNSKEIWEIIQEGCCEPLDEIRDSAEMLWSVANDERDLAARRCVASLSALLWLAGYGTVVDTHFRGDLKHYGKKELVIASEIAGVDWEPYDDGNWRQPDLSPQQKKEVIKEAQGVARSVS